MNTLNKISRVTFRIGLAAVAVSLVVLGVPLLWMMVDATADCRMNNYSYKDYADEIEAEIKEFGPGRIGMSALASKYDQVCIITIQEPGYPQLPGELKGPNIKRLGRNVCEMWNQNLVAFALISGRAGEKNYVLATWRFNKLLKGDAVMSGRRCGKVKTSVIECRKYGLFKQGSKCEIAEVEGGE